MKKSEYRRIVKESDILNMVKISFLLKSLRENKIKINDNDRYLLNSVLKGYIDIVSRCQNEVVNK